VTGLLALLPTASDLPDDLTLDQEDADLTTPEVAAEADDAASYAAQLTAWTYRGGASRQFVLPDPGLGDFVSKLLGFQALVLEFGSAAPAREALDFQHSYALQRAGWDLQDVAGDAVGDASVTLTGTADYEGTTVQAVVVLVQRGARLYRFVAISGLADELDMTLRIARSAVQ
jgi:hypothetical protein